MFASPKLLLFWDVNGGMIHYITSKLTVFILGMTFWYNYCGHNAIPAEQNLGCGVYSRKRLYRPLHFHNDDSNHLCNKIGHELKDDFFFFNFLLQAEMRFPTFVYSKDNTVTQVLSLVR